MSNTQKSLPNASDEAGWADWIRQRLAVISSYQSNLMMADMVSMSQPSGSRLDATEYKRNTLLKTTINDLKGAFPPRIWVDPAGKEHIGSLLPEVILGASYSTDKKLRIKGNLLNFAVTMKNTPAPTLTWLVASGFDPLKFNHDTKNTPLGASAYAGRARYVAVFRKMGLPLDLTLYPHHLERKDEERFLGTTLLHRVAARDRPSGEACVAVIKELLRSGLDPLQENAAGQTPLSVARGSALEFLKVWVSENQQKQFSRQTPRAQGKPSKPVRL